MHSRHELRPLVRVRESHVSAKEMQQAYSIGCDWGDKKWNSMGRYGCLRSWEVDFHQSHPCGITKVNGSPGAISKYKKIIGYVPQDDVVLPELTIGENVLHSARIRLASDWKEDQIQSHVDILLKCLNLFHVKDSLVGSTPAPVVSGGERDSAGRCSHGSLS